MSGANDLCPFLSGASVWVGYYRLTDGGRSWRDGLVPGYRGDTSAADGVLDLVFYDSRADPVYLPDRPPGNDAGGHNVGLGSRRVPGHVLGRRCLVGRASVELGR